MSPILRRLFTLRWIALTAVVIVGVLVFGQMAWWQWQTYQHDGSPQNLAYTFQWPVFAGFGVYMWWRMLRESALGAPEESESEETALSNGKIEESPYAEGTSGEPAGSGADASAGGVGGAEELIARLGRAKSVRSAGNAVPAQAEDDPQFAAYNRYLQALDEAASTTVGPKGTA